YEESVRKTIESCLTAQAMIDINAKHLEGLRTECAISAELTQNEIRGLETKLVKLFSRQLVAKRKCKDSHNITELRQYPQLRQWLRVVGLGDKSINGICDRITTFDALLKSSEQQMKEILREKESPEEEIRRILTALKNLKLSIDKLMAGEFPLELDLHWDSWDRTTSTTNTNSISSSSATASPRITRNRTMRSSVPSDETLKNSSPLSPPQSAGLWSSQTGSYILNANTNSKCGDASRPTPPSTPTITAKKNGGNPSERKFPTTPPPKIRNLLADPFPLVKSKSHEEHLANRIEPLDPAIANQLILKYITNANHNHHNSLDNLPHQHRRRLATEPGYGHTSPIITPPSRSPPVVSPDQTQDNCFVDTPVAPRSPRSHGMAHSIHHRFSTTMKIISTCNLCEKPMFFGFKCKDCKYRCHRDCVEKVPNSCGLPNELVDIFKQTINSEERRSPVVPNISAAAGARTQSEILGRKAHKKRTQHYNQPMINLPSFAGHDSSSNTSSCNSSTPSSPALISYPSMTSTQTPPQSASIVGRVQQFQFPEISFSNTISFHDNYNTIDGITIETKPFSESEVIDTQKSTDSDKTVSGTSGSGSTDSEKTLAGRGDWLTIPKGWLCYLAPEIVRSLRIHSEQETEELPFSTATDVYAFGTVWYELLLGEWPFKGQPSEVIIWQVGKGVKQSLINLQTSKEVKDLLLICWSFKPHERTEFSKLYDILTRLPKKRLQRSPSHPIHLLRSAESLF
ncbi:unnamed protein product, partial [Medioppia subpectinata]